MVNTALVERLVEEEIVKALLEERYPIDHALGSPANWKVASPVPEESPKLARPVLLTLKSVAVAEAVEEAMAKSIELVSPLRACTANLANGEVVPTPTFVPFVRARNVLPDTVSAVVEALVTVSLSRVLLKVKVESAPKAEPPSLNCTSVSLPAAEPPLVRQVSSIA